MKYEEWKAETEPSDSEAKYASESINHHNTKEHEFIKLVPVLDWEWDPKRKMYHLDGQWKESLEESPGSLNPNWKGDFGLLLFHDLQRWHFPKRYRLYLKGGDDTAYEKFFEDFDRAYELFDLLRESQPLNLRKDILPYGFKHI
ncbi:hypothetical protein GF420_15705 [candidate division GN15 bacterium]|nr:hypothetical protein [candidate division GN15 bacterium]